jgi:hypothetical protein
MSLQEQNVTEAVCAAQGLDLRCINPRNQLWDDTHGDWFPGCIDASTAELGTPYPTLPDYPQDNETCTDTAYEEFVDDAATQYDFMANLTNGGVLYWSVQNETISGKISHNGLFGFVAFGFGGSPEEENAMIGAKIIMAKPSSVYNASTGFDFDFEPSVDEHVIGTEFAFRHWQTPVSSVSRAVAASAIVSDISSYQVQETECFTSMTFQTAGIFDQAFNVTGTDRMIWAANGVDMFAGYHGDSQGILLVEWATGTVTLVEHDHEEDEDHDDADHDHEDHDHDHEESGEGDVQNVGSSAFGIGLATTVMIASVVLSVLH